MEALLPHKQYYEQYVQAYAKPSSSSKKDVHVCSHVMHHYTTITPLPQHKFLRRNKPHAYSNSTFLLDHQRSTLDLYDFAPVLSMLTVHCQTIHATTAFRSSTDSPRANQNTACTNSIDKTGPLFVDGLKIWILLETCLATRAIFLE